MNLTDANVELTHCDEQDEDSPIFNSCESDPVIGYLRMTISFTAERSACNLFCSFRTEHKQQNTSTRPPVTRYDCYRNDNKLCYFKMS